MASVEAEGDAILSKGGLHKRGRTGLEEKSTKFRVRYWIFDVCGAPRKCSPTEGGTSASQSWETVVSGDGCVNVGMGVALGLSAWEWRLRGQERLSGRRRRERCSQKRTWSTSDASERFPAVKPEKSPDWIWNLWGHCWLKLEILQWGGWARCQIGLSDKSKRGIHDHRKLNPNPSTSHIGPVAPSCWHQDGQGSQWWWRFSFMCSSWVCQELAIDGLLHAKYCSGHPSPKDK